MQNTRHVAATYEFNLEHGGASLLHACFRSPYFAMNSLGSELFVKWRKHNRVDLPSLGTEQSKGRKHRKNGWRCSAPHDSFVHTWRCFG